MKHTLRKSRKNANTSENAEKAEIKSVVSSMLAKQHTKRYAGKFLDTVYSAVSPAYNSVPYAVSAPPQGTTDGTRTGDTIRLSRIQGKFYYSGSNLHALRFVLVRWHPFISAYGPNLGSILQSAPSITYGIMSQYTFDVKRLFQVVYDTTVLCDPYNQSKFFQFDIPANWEVKFSNNGTDCTEWLSLVMIQDGSVSLNSVSGVLRVVYHDETK